MDKELKKLTDIPYTISFVIRKRQQIDSFNELPKEKRPPDKMIWEGTSEDIEDWLDKVFDRKHTEEDQNILISLDEVER